MSAKGLPNSTAPGRGLRSVADLVLAELALGAVLADEGALDCGCLGCSGGWSGVVLAVVPSCR